MQVLPKGDLVLARVAEAEETTTGGILLPGSAQARPTSGDVVALGDGQVGSRQHAFSLEGGETVLYSKFGIGVTELEVQGQTHILIREDDIIGVMPRANATAAGEAGAAARGTGRARERADAWAGA
jgi:chaperonin GroES